MSSAALHLIPYALIAALSPLGFAATLAVMGSGRLKALAFGCAFVAGQLVACAILVAIGAAAVPSRENGHPTLQAALDLGFGLALIWLAVVVRRRPRSTSPSHSSSKRTKAALERLGRLRVLTALAAGALLGVGGPKRLVLSALAAASIAASGVDTGQKAVLVLWYTGLATLLVWAPIICFEIFGQRAIAVLSAGQGWMAERQQQIVFYALIVLGLVLIFDGLVTLH